jgi:hypothetical protein
MKLQIYCGKMEHTEKEKGTGGTYPGLTDTPKGD